MRVLSPTDQSKVLRGSQRKPWTEKTPRQQVQSLLKTLNSADAGWWHKQDVLSFLGDMGPKAKSAVPDLIQAFKKNRYFYNLIIPIIITLGKIGPDAKDAIPYLLDTLQDTNFGFPIESAISLGQIGPNTKEAMDALINILEDDLSSYELRKEAATALGKAQLPDGIRKNRINKALAVAATNDDLECVQFAASRALANLHSIKPLTSKI